MRKIILIAILSLLNLNLAFAVQQVPDKLHYDNKEYNIHTYPLESYPKVDKIRSKAPAEPSCTRKYIAEWIIKDQKLYWIDVKKSEKILAQWFTGKIAISIDAPIDESKKPKKSKQINKAKIFNIHAGIIKTKEIATLNDYNQLKKSIKLIKSTLKKYEKEMAEIQATLFSSDRKRKKLRIEEKELKKQLSSKKKQDIKQLKIKIEKLGTAIVAIRTSNNILHSRLVRPREEYNKLMKEFHPFKEKYNALSNLF